MRAYFQRIALEAGIDLPVSECWVLVQVRRGYADPALLSERSGAPDSAVRSALSDLEERGLVSIENNGDQAIALTEDGLAMADRLLAHIRDRLENLLEGWSPEQYPDLAKLLDEFATEVIPATQPVQSLTA